ncbi:MAG: TlpA family protein disulfide reductase [Melioribacteraceae bacterium]|nr:TlpA family protein disulfide reductase [Melioribacteraceae bacterium]
MGQKHHKKVQQEEIPAQFSEKQKKWIKGGIFIAIILGLFIVNNLDGEPDNGPYPPGYLEFSGSTLKLSDYQGKIIILDFWATWCAPCRKAIPELIELGNEYEDKGVQVIGITMDDTDQKSNVEKFIDEFEIDYPVVWGNESIIYKYGGIQTIPTSFIIDKNGKVISRYNEYVPKETYENDIKDILSGKFNNRELVNAPDFELPLVKENNFR